jgi:hypothetical protein
MIGPAIGGFLIDPFMDALAFATLRADTADDSHSYRADLYPSVVTWWSLKLACPVE